MNKKHWLNLGLVSALSIAPLAQAVHLNARGLGEVLVYPYYTVNSGNQTLVTVVNTTDQGKAIKVRFLEGMNSREVLGFNLYLAPFDVWVGSVASLTDDAALAQINAAISSKTSPPLANTVEAILVVPDKSCTAPELQGNLPGLILPAGYTYALFANSNYTGAHNDSGPDDLTRTREGHFEMIEMGEVVNRENTSLTAITQGSDGVPGNCAQIRNAWNAGGYWAANSMADMNPPGGGLYGSAMMVDVLNGTMLTYNAEALDDFSSIVQHTGPGNSLPNISSAVSDAAQGTAQALVFDKGSPVTLSYPIATQAVDAVSAVLTVDNLFNDFLTSPELGARSEWVVTFPTKRFYTDLPAGTPAAIPPFVNLFPREGSIAQPGVGVYSGSAPVTMKLEVWDRENGPLLGESCYSELMQRDSDDCFFVYTELLDPYFPPSLNWASNVIRFNDRDPDSPPAYISLDRTPILGSKLWYNVQAVDSPGDPNPTPQVQDGRMQLSFHDTLLLTDDPATPGNDPDVLLSYPYLKNHLLRPDQQGRRLQGLPAVGFSAVSITNSNVTPGILANYSGTVKHQGSQSLAPNL